jgi:hypothetical protein
MSDYDSSLPARTEEAGDIDVFISDGTTTGNPANKLKVHPNGSVDTNTTQAPGSKIIITDGDGDDIDVNPDGSVNAVVTATNLDIRELDAAQDSVEAIQDTHDDLNANANIQVADVDVSDANPVPMSDAGGSITVDAENLDIRDLAFVTDSVDVSGSEVALDAATLAALEEVTVQNGAGAAAVNIQDGGNSITIDDGGTSITVDAVDLDIRELTHASGTPDSVQIGDGVEILQVNTDGSINVKVDNDISGDEICVFETSTLAAGATIDHDYAVTAAKTFIGQNVWASGSGKIKVTVLVNAIPKFVGFNSTANPNVNIPLAKICKANATEVVRITIENRENQPQDVYSTLTGVEV